MSLISPSSDSYIEITSLMKGIDHKDSCVPVRCNIIEPGELFTNGKEGVLGILVERKVRNKLLKDFVIINEIHLFITSNLNKSWKQTTELETIVDIKFGDVFGKGKNSMLALSNCGRVYCFNIWKLEKDY